jgi:serine protease Do
MINGQPSGALVGEVEPNAPAAKAGIKTGDLIMLVNGKKVSDARELRLMIGSMPPGTRVQIAVNRDGQTKAFEVQLAEMPSGAAQEGAESAHEENPEPEKTTVFGGVGVTNLTDDIRSALNLPWSQSAKI